MPIFRLNMCHHVLNTIYPVAQNKKFFVSLHLLGFYFTKRAVMPEPQKIELKNRTETAYIHYQVMGNILPPDSATDY